MPTSGSIWQCNCWYECKVSIRLHGVAVGSFFLRSLEVAIILACCDASLSAIIHDLNLSRAG